MRSRPASFLIVFLLRTADVGLDGIRSVNQRLPLRRGERAVVDETVDLIDEGVELIAGRARLTAINLDHYLVDLVNQLSSG